MTAQQLTALNLDKTAVLDDVVQRNYNKKPQELLGELQFSFLAFLMGHSLEGIDPGIMHPVHEACSSVTEPSPGVHRQKVCID